MVHTPEEIANAKKVARKIQAKIDDAVRPLELEMRIMKWKPEYRMIVWEMLMHKAAALAKEAAKEAT